MQIPDTGEEANDCQNRQHFEQQLSRQKFPWWRFVGRHKCGYFKGCVGGEGETHITIGNLTIENIHIQWVRNNLIRNEFGLRGSIKNQFPLFTSFAVLPLFCRLLLFWQTEANAAGNCGAVGEWGSNRWGMYIKRNRWNCNWIRWFQNGERGREISLGSYFRNNNSTSGTVRNPNQRADMCKSS